MQVPSKNLEKWIKLLDRGDKMKIAKELNLTSRVVAEALDNGVATADVIVMINGWFKKKAMGLKKQLN